MSDWQTLRAQYCACAPGVHPYVDHMACAWSKQMLTQCVSVRRGDHKTHLRAASRSNPSGRDVFELLYDVSHVASALALQDNTQLLTFLKNNSKWPGLQKVVRKVPKVGSKGIASLLIDASGISFLVEHLLVSHKETH